MTRPVGRPPIRNACVARGELGANMVGILYTVPAEFVFLLKSVYFLNAGPGNTGFWLDAQTPDRSVIVRPVAIEQSTATQGAWEGWLAMNGGDQLCVNSPPSINVWYWIAGALLPWAPAGPLGLGEVQTFHPYEDPPPRVPPYALP